MGGSVTVESKVGVGSEFVLNIKTHCKIKKFKVEEGAQQSQPFTFVQKKSEEEDQKCFVKDFIDKDLMCQ